MPPRVEQEQQCVALAAGEGEVRVARQPLRAWRRAVQDRVGDASEHLADEVVPQRRQPLGLSDPPLRADHRRDRERPDRGRVQGARPDVAFLAAAVQHRHRRHATAQDQRAGPDRAAQLVRGHGHRVHAGRGEVDRQLRGRLHRVGVERHAELVRHLGQRRDRLHGADLVVGPHHAHHGRAARVARQRFPQHRRPDQPGSVDATQSAHAPEAVASQRTESSTAWCSTAVVSTRLRRSSAARRAQNRPFTARLSASVPPLVKITSLARAPNTSAICSRDSSTTRRARRPASCSDEGLPSRPVPPSSRRSPRAATAWSRHDRGIRPG